MKVKVTIETTKNNRLQQQNIDTAIDHNNSRDNNDPVSEQYKKYQHIIDDYLKQNGHDTFLRETRKHFRT